MEENKELLCISPCCQKGVSIAKKFITELALLGLIYEYKQTTPRKVMKTIAEHGMDINKFTDKGYILIEDLLFEANDLKKDHYKKTLIEQIKIINKAEEK